MSIIYLEAIFMPKFDSAGQGKMIMVLYPGLCRPV